MHGGSTKADLKKVARVWGSLDREIPAAPASCCSVIFPRPRATHNQGILRLPEKRLLTKAMLGLCMCTVAAGAFRLVCVCAVYACVSTLILSCPHVSLVPAWIAHTARHQLLSPPRWRATITNLPPPLGQPPRHPATSVYRHFATDCRDSLESKPRV